MNLKESYRYANHLDRLLDKSYYYLRNRDFVTTTKQLHLRSKAITSGVDETIVVEKPYDVDFKPIDLINFAVKVIDEKERLMDAIAKAKAGAEINIDNAIAMNKKKQGFIGVLSALYDLRPCSRKTTSSDYTFNANNEQTRYVYNVESSISIDYDRNDVRKLMKKLQVETDEVSAKLDSVEINIVVDFECAFDINDDFEDVVMAK